MTQTAARKLAAFAIITALLALGLHGFLSWSLRRVTVTDLGAFNAAMQGRVNADIVVSGSSRAFRHYDPRVLAGETGLTCFNLSRNASQTDVQLGVLKAYLRHNQKPRLVLQNLDLHSFILTKPGEIYDPSQYVPYLDDPEIYACLSRINDQLWKWKRVPLYAYAVEDTLFTWTMGIRCLLGLPPREACYDGFSPMAKSWTKDFEHYKRAHPSGVDIDIDPAGVAALQALVELCQQNDIRLVFVYSPQFHEMIGLTRNREKIFALFRFVAGKHAIPIIDYTYSPISQTQGYFYNAQHLNAQGADVFSHDLARKLTESGIIARLPQPVPSLPRTQAK